MLQPRAAPHSLPAADAVSPPRRAAGAVTSESSKCDSGGAERARLAGLCKTASDLAVTPVRWRGCSRSQLGHLLCIEEVQMASWWELGASARLAFLANRQGKN